MNDKCAMDEEMISILEQAEIWMSAGAQRHARGSNTALPAQWKARFCSERLRMLENETSGLEVTPEKNYRPKAVRKPCAFF